MYGKKLMKFTLLAFVLSISAIANANVSNQVSCRQLQAMISSAAEKHEELYSRFTSSNSKAEREQLYMEMKALVGQMTAATNQWMKQNCAGW